MKTLIPTFATVLLIFITSCRPGPQKIHYGHQACDYCRMSIVDERYAAQLVSTTGKTFSFDALECMLHFREENPGQSWELELVTDYNTPGKLLPARESYILRSKQLPSPMGMYLTATGSREAARELRQKHPGKVYSYPEIIEELDKLPAL